MDILLVDTEHRKNFFPLTLTRAVADLRMGIFTIKERWEKISGLRSFVVTEPYLAVLYQEVVAAEYLVIDSSVLASHALFQQLQNLQPNCGLFDERGFIACKVTLEANPSSLQKIFSLIVDKQKVDNIPRLSLPSDIFQLNDDFIRHDFELVTKGELSNNRSIDTTHLIKPSHIFIDDSAKIDHSILNASTGPIYIGKNAVVMEGSLIRGPFAMCENAVLKMGSKVYGATTLGPGCVAGGEIKNAVMMGYSNKAHDGYLGDSVVGEWCNMGAGTSNSNVKNTAGDVKLWNHYANDFISVGLKCGLIMGDYSRTSINTSINTGTLMGLCCNVFGEGLTPKVIPNFTWGTKELTRYEFDKALKDIDNWKKMKGKHLTENDKIILKYIFDNYND